VTDFITSRGRALAGSRRLAVWSVALAPVVLVARAFGWATVEHQEIGRTAYLRACADVRAAVTARGSPSAGVADRLERVCGPNLPVIARLYGDATAIAGDFLGHPEEFLSHRGFWRFSHKKYYWLLALENSAHFNPTSTRSWADYHEAALAHALAGATADGLRTVEELELAMFESAFADHYLQDSFAAGHMGFNRAASSAAAAKSFHDAWNARGRVVTDRAGNRWVTYGDGRLDAPVNAEGRRHVLDAATFSVRGVLTVFVLGVRGPADELAVWQLLPFTIEAPELPAELVEIFRKASGGAEAGGELVPLQVTIRPTRKDLVATASFWSAAAFATPGDPILALVGGIELGIPIVPAQTYLGAGGTVRAPGEQNAAVVEAGVLIPLGLSVSGLISHQLNVTGSWLIRRDMGAVVHADYQLNVELGDALLSLQVGLAGLFPQPRAGYFAAAGLGFVFSAAGGGAF